MRFLDRVQAIWTSPEHYEHLERMIMATAADYATRLDAVSNELAAELAELRQKLSTATADEAARLSAEWAQALDGPIARLEGMGHSEQTPDAPANDPAGATDVPAETPATDEPNEANGSPSA